MRIRVSLSGLRRSVNGMLSVSRIARKCEAEMEQVYYELGRLSEMEKCRAELKKQIEAVELETGRLANLSTSLAEITEQYERTEEQNHSVLEERVRFLYSVLSLKQIRNWAFSEMLTRFLYHKDEGK